MIAHVPAQTAGCRFSNREQKNRIGRLARTILKIVTPKCAAGVTFARRFLPLISRPRSGPPSDPSEFSLHLSRPETTARSAAAIIFGRTALVEVRDRAPSVRRRRSVHRKQGAGAIGRSIAPARRGRRRGRRVGASDTSNSGAGMRAGTESSSATSGAAVPLPETNSVLRCRTSPYGLAGSSPTGLPEARTVHKRSPPNRRRNSRISADDGEGARLRARPGRPRRACRPPALLPRTLGAVRIHPDVVNWTMRQPHSQRHPRNRTSSE